jgi:tetratricopeptide (TPR) repeat protein
MERKKYLIIAFLIIPLMSVFADNKSEIYSAYINNRMDQWKSVIDRMQVSKPASDETLLELINYQYGYIGYCLGFKKEDEAEKYLDLAENNTEQLEKKNYKPSVLSAYRSAFYGYRIALNRLSAPVNGMKSLNNAKKAIETDAGNYLGYVQYGNAKFYMPSSFGGSKQEALGHFSKARKLLEADPQQLRGNWNYLSLLVTIGQSYTYLKEFDKAKAVYDEILKIEPGFLYVKNDLYPKLLTKMKQ